MVDPRERPSLILAPDAQRHLWVRQYAYIVLGLATAYEAFALPRALRLGLGFVDGTIALLCAGLAALLAMRAAIEVLIGYTLLGFGVAQVLTYVAVGFAGPAALIPCALPVLTALFLGGRAPYRVLAASLGSFATVGLLRVGTHWLPPPDARLVDPGLYASWVELALALAAVVGPVVWLVARVTQTLRASFVALGEAMASHETHVRLRIAADAELERAIEQRQAARRAEASGLLVAGVVHDLRNNLNVLQLSCGALGDDRSAGAVQQDAVARIRAICLEASAVTVDLLRVARPPAPGAHDARGVGEATGTVGAALAAPIAVGPRVTSTSTTAAEGDGGIDSPAFTMPDTEMGALRVQLARRIARHTLALGAPPVAICLWQARHGTLAIQLMVLADVLTLVLCAAAAFLDVRPRLRIGLVLGGFALVPVSCSLSFGLLPGLAGGAAVVWLIAAFLLGPRAALAVGIFLELGLLAIGAVHRADPSWLARRGPFCDVTVGDNWARTALSLLALTAAVVPAMIGHLRALGEANLRSRDLLSAVEREERKRAHAAAARARTEAERRDNAGLNVLDAVGVGFAHRCGNLLQVVSTEIDRLRATSAEPGQAFVRDRLADMAEVVRASAAVLGRLLALGDVDPTATVAPIDLGEFAYAARRQVCSLRGIEVVARVEPGPRVLADASGLHGVVLNLALNARDAMPRGGRVTITARPASEAEALATGCCAALDVADTGSGMDAATLARVFQPFFTTKGAAGTGLGLNAARRVLEAAGGRITVKSELGSGTTFTLHLPAAADAPSHTRHVLPSIAVSGRGAPVLVVDSDADARRGWCAALRDRDFLALEAGDVDAALSIASTHRVALVWMDAVTPGRPPRVLIDGLRRTQPRAHVVVCSVLASQGISREELRAWGIDWIAKPCSLSVFLSYAARAAASYSRAS
jgi:signal transduction histidine kinase/CheY-like chemotaxis protein